MSTRLEQEVWGLQRCSGCGVCVAACSKGVLYWGEEQHPLLEERQKVLGLSRTPLRACEVCERFCELTCPRLADQPAAEPLDMVSARTASVLQSGAPNDVIRSLLVAARTADLIDGVVMLDLDPWTMEPLARVATSVNEIVSGMGMQFLWAPVLSVLNEAIFDKGLNKLAIVGPPCVAEGTRHLLETDHNRLRPYRGAIRLSIASFCTGIYLPEMIPQLLEKGLGISRHQISRLTTSVAEGALTISLWDGSERAVPLTEVEPFTRRGCGSCDDYLGESADIAVGGVGAQPGYATLVVRTPAGGAFLHNAVRTGLLETVAKVDRTALDAARSEKDRRARAKALDAFRILMLDALGDPRLQAQLRQQFVNLYGVPQKETSNGRHVNVGCGGC